MNQLDPMPVPTIRPAPKPPASTTPSVFVVAGEPSGDALGGRLIAALKRARPEIEVRGIGGEHMAEQGLESLFPMHELTVMGLFEVLRHLPRLRRRILETVEAVKLAKPDALVTIDAPDFSFRVAKRLKREGIPLIHYVAPTVWAWRPGRAKTISRFLDQLLTVLPFEPPFFTRHGLAASFVGHPAVEEERRGDAAAFRSRHGLSPDAPLLALLPGSRPVEIRHMLPVFLDVLRLLRPIVPGLQAVIPVVPSVRAQIEAGIGFSPLPILMVDPAEKQDAFAASTVALATSGTVALELGLAGTPTVVAYIGSPATIALARRLVRVRYMSLINILLDREVQPEYLQKDATPSQLAEAVLALLEDVTAQTAQKMAGAMAAAQLGRGGPKPSDRAASVVLHLIDQHRAPTNAPPV